MLLIKSVDLIFFVTFVENKLAKERKEENNVVLLFKNLYQLSCKRRGKAKRGKDDLIIYNLKFEVTT